MTNPWEKIFEHDFEDAYKIADKNYLQSAEDFYLRARAKSSLLLRNYNTALADFLLLIEIEKNSNRKYDGTYMDIGLCYYALGDIENAIDYFKYPIINKKEKMGTSDTSVPPCVLLFIGVKSGRQDIVKIAMKELKMASKFKTAAPNYLLGTFSEIELDNEFQQYSNATMRNRKQCKVEFYKAIHYLQNGLNEKYKHHIKGCVELTGTYLEFEYYIAKVEYEIYLNGSHEDKSSFWQRIFDLFRTNKKSRPKPGSF
jgi:tetratricopeptide (TPR) repeat protein